MVHELHGEVELPFPFLSTLIIYFYNEVQLDLRRAAGE